MRVDDAHSETNCRLQEVLLTIAGLSVSRVARTFCI